MPTLSRSTARRGAMILLILLTVAACSSGGAGSPGGATTAPAGSQAPAAPTMPAGSTGPSLDPAAGSPCYAIKLADAQVLLKDTITQNNFSLEGLGLTQFDCELLTAVGGMSVTIQTTDIFARWVAGENIGAGTALTGVGDKAVWLQALGNPPVVIAIKGSVTCRVSVGDTEKSTIEFTASSAGFDKITPAAAASFAQKMAVLCTDVFDAAS